MDKDDILFQFKKIDLSIIRLMGKDNSFRQQLSPTQVRVILYMLNHKDEDIYQKDIENYLSISRASVSDVLNTMEKNKIIKRVINTNDTRTKKVILNDDVIKSHVCAVERLKYINKIIKKDISKDDLNTFIKVLDMMQINLNKEIK